MAQVRGKQVQPQKMRVPGPGSPRTGLGPWGGGASQLRTWETLNLNQPGFSSSNRPFNSAEARTQTNGSFSIPQSLSP